MNIASQARLEDIAAEYTANEYEDAGQNFLLVKMLVVLRNMHYGDETLQKVASRVATNFCWQSEPYLTSEERTFNVIQQKLMNRVHDFTVNSNEPVLLISLPQAFSTTPSSVVVALKDAAITHLRNQGIKPVRVYTRRAGESISLLLLNVVNTDIGGPSMIQLLDAAFHGSDWSHDLLSKEAYHEYDLLWRDEHWLSNETRPEHFSQIVGHSEPDCPEADEVVNSIVEGPEIPSQCISSEAQMEAGLDQSVDDDCHKIEMDEAQDKDVDVDDSEERVQHPEWTAWRERDSARAPIQHPTWSHKYEDTSFLDLIISQSATVGDDHPLSIIPGDRIQHKTDESSSEHGANEEFVIVGAGT